MQNSATLAALFSLLLTTQASAGFITSVSVTGQEEVRVVQIAPTPLGEDALAYTDRNHEWNDLPSELPQLLDAQYIMTANDDRDDENLQITLTLSMRSTLWMFLDTRIAGDNINQNTPLPWMTDLGLVDTGYDIGLDSHGNGVIETRHSIYSGIFDAGDVVLLSENRRGVAQYGIAVTAPPVPEPASVAIFALGSLGVVPIVRRRRRKQGEH